MRNEFSKFINLQGKYLTSLLILLALSIGNVWAYTYNHATSVPEWTVNFNTWSAEDDAATKTEATVHNPRLFWNSTKWDQLSAAQDVAFDADGFYYIYQPGTARQLPTGSALSALSYVVAKAQGSYFKYNSTSSTVTSPVSSINGLTTNSAQTADVTYEFHMPRAGYVRLLIGTDSNGDPTGTANDAWKNIALSGATTGNVAVTYHASGSTYDVKTKTGATTFSTVTYTSAGKKMRSVEFALNSGTTTMTTNPAKLSNNSGTARKMFIYAVEVYLEPACTKPDAPTGLSCTAQTVNSLTFGWTKETNAVGYVAKLYSDSGCETEVDSKDLGDVNTVTFTGLSNSTTYYCKVQSKGNGTTYCEDGNVTSAANGTTDAPSCGVVTAPTSLLVGATTADGAPFTIIDDADAFNYEFYVSESSTEPESSATATHTSTEKTKDVTGLTSGTTYYAWVRSVCDADHKSTWTAANKSFKVRTNPTASFADANYIIGMSAINVADNFTSNSGATVVYELKESYPNVTLTGSSFSATAAGEYVVVANQAGNADYTPISKEATITVLDNEMSDTYVWKKGTGYTGCVANPNADAPAAQYTDIAYEGFTGMGRAAADNTECILTFTVKAAYSATFGIKSICTYGKLEEPLGGQISWDGGTSWENLAAYSEGKKEFNAPSATFPTSFKIRFLGVSASSGGLYWRNALVTLEVKKTVTGVTEALVGAEINGEAISAANLATLLEDKTLDIATAYAAAPTVTFKKQVTTTYSGGWSPDVEDVDVEVTASDNTTAWQASATINAQAYTINLAKPAGPSLETEATAFTLTSAKIATDTKSFTFSGVNLTSGNVTISLESPVAGMTVSPAEVTPTAGAITDQEVTITYKSLEAVAEANVNLVVYYDADTKITIPLTYSSTAGYEDLTSISAATTWNWDGAASAAYGTLGQNEMIILANADVTWDEGFNARAIAGKLQHYYRDSKYAQGNELKFNTTIPGKVYVTYSNTGGNPARTVNVNGTKGSLTTAGTGEKRTESFAVTAGDVLIKGVLVSDDSNQMLRYYEVRFAPVFAVTYGAGEGSVKGGETMPTQADEAAGEKITLAAATALEKDGYDFAGWLCDIDAQTYQPGDEYTMTAAATTFTAQWVLHVDPVDPTLTYDNGAYTIGLAALDLSTLITAKTSTGAITYSVKEAGTTGAAIDGNNFTATAAGTATITASQAAVLGYNAITVDFDVVVTEATEIDGIKLVEAGALTGNFITGSSLSDGEYTIEGIHYEKYLKFGSTFSGSYNAGARTNYIFYDLKKENTTFYVYAHNNTSTAGKIIVYTYNTASAKYAEVPVAASENAIKSFSLNDIDANTRVFIGVDNTNIYFCQVVAVESGADLMKGGQAGYTIDFSAKSRFSGATGVAITLDGMEFVTSSGYTPNSSTEVGLGAIGTNYVKFVLDTKTLVEVKTNSTNQYYIGSTYAAEAETSKTYGYKPAAAGETHSFELEAGTWYLNPNTSNIKLQKLAFMLPKCAEPEFNALANSDICSGDPYVALDGTATVADGGEPTYQWYNAANDEAIDGATAATYTPSADGSYYVIATNHLADHSDNVKQSATVTVTTYASAQITTAPTDVRQKVGEDATLTVVASGKAPLSYLWYTCDDAEGNNPVIITGAEEDSYSVTVTDGLDQYYKVVVSSGCGEASAVARIVEWVALPQLSVSATTTWDWVDAGENIKLTGETTPKKNEECVMANVKVGGKMPTNNATFNSQALLFYGENVRNVESDRAYASIGHIKFTTTVAGKVTVEFSDNGTNNRKLKINNAVSESSASKTDVKTFSAVVPAGEVTLMGVKNDGTGSNEYIRISKIIFEVTPDVSDADYTRDVRQGYYGTICLPNGGVMVGADIFEVAYYGATSEKIFFDEIMNGVMEAGVPYIFLPREGATQLGVYYTDAADASATNRNGLYGSYDRINLDDNAGNYILKDNKYYYVNTTNVYCGANRAYIKLGEINPKETALAPGRRRIAMGFEGQQVATGVDEIINDQSPMTNKVIIDGRLFIIRGEKMYDATGRLVK